MLGNIWERIRTWFEAVGAKQLALPDPLSVAAKASTPPLPQRSAPMSAPEALDRDREIRVAQRSRTLAIRLFGANHPVENPRDLFGRQRELDELCSSVLDGAMHAVIYGPRGSGKTSLARIFGDLADQRGASVLYLSCAGGGDFGDIMLPYLDDIEGESFGMRAHEYSAAVAAVSAAPTPRSLAGLLARIDQEDVILILDEFDRLENPETKGQLALLIKLLADMRTRVRLVFVGISGDLDELIDVHKSVRRHLVAIGLTPIADEEVEKFIRTTGRTVGLNFSADAVALLRWLVCGSPYHMRVYGLQACLVALDRNQRDVDDKIVLAGLDRAVGGWKSMNVRDAALFDALVKNRAFPYAAIEALAAQAATKLEFTPAELAEALATADLDPALVPPMIEALAPALGRMSDTAPRLVFEDVLAPQFLLAMCAAARIGGKEQVMIIKGSD